MLSAPEAFMAVSNATAAIVQKAPPYVTYRIHGVVHAAGDANVERTISVRTSDGDAVVRDEATGKDVLRPPFPAPPNFDALSKFSLSGTFTITTGGKGGTKRDVDMRVVNIEPLYYTNPATQADAVSRSVRGYVVTYAADASATVGHLHLEPTPQKRSETKWLREVWYDPATLIPTRVVYGGHDDFVLDTTYATTGGVWLLSSLTVSVIKHAPLWLGRMTLAFRGDYADYQFAQTAPDPRLDPAYVAPPQPSASPAVRTR